MRSAMSMIAAGLAGMALATLIDLPQFASAQQQPAQPRFAAVPGERGGQDPFGPYEPVADWPKDLTTLPGHEGWMFGSGSSVFAESPNRVFVLQRGEPGKETRPGYMNNVHGVAVDPKTRQVFVNDRANRRIQVFDENGKYLREWSVGASPADVHTIHIFSDGYLWAADRGTNKMVKYDPNGNFMYAWGIWGDFPGGMWGVHDFSVDQEGNVYVAEVDNGGAQKYRPRKGANPAFMLGKPIRAAWK